MVFVRNGYEDQVPGKLPENPGYVMGNSVAIRWAKNTDAVVFMAHFMKGSSWSEGSDDQAGQPIGRCRIPGIPLSPIAYPRQFADITNPDLFGQVGIGVPLYFDLEDGLRMPVGGDDPEIVRAKQQNLWCWQRFHGPSDIRMAATTNHLCAPVLTKRPRCLFSNHPRRFNWGLRGGDPAEGTLTRKRASSSGVGESCSRRYGRPFENQRPKSSGVFGGGGGVESAVCDGV